LSFEGSLKAPNQATLLVMGGFLKEIIRILMTSDAKRAQNLIIIIIHVDPN
jgi:hypothetical protein